MGEALVTGLIDVRHEPDSLAVAEPDAGTDAGLPVRTSQASGWLRPPPGWSATPTS